MIIGYRPSTLDKQATFYQAYSAKTHIRVLAHADKGQLDISNLIRAQGTQYYLPDLRIHGYQLGIIRNQNYIILLQTVYSSIFIYAASRVTNLLVTKSTNPIKKPVPEATSEYPIRNLKHNTLR